MTKLDKLSHGFAAVSGPEPRVLILGSLPGTASIAAQRYYAHPRNAFWPIVGTILGIPTDAPYDERVRCLTAAHIALWDVVRAAVRPGSLDSAIRAETVEPNPISPWLAARPTVQAVLLNGGKAATLFERHVIRGTSPPFAIEQVPSTSPAYAAMSAADKQSHWQAALARYLPLP